jgi:hypothetical protein
VAAPASAFVAAFSRGGAQAAVNSAPSISMQHRDETIIEDTL